MCVPGWAQEGTARIQAEIERLRQSFPEKFEPANVKTATDDLLKASSSALQSVNVYLSLEKLGQAADYLQGARAALEKSDAFESEWAAASRALEASGRTLRAVNWNGAPAALRALSETARVKAVPLLDGARGFATATRASRFGRIKDYHTRAEEEICVLVQVETRTALDNLEAIAACDGVDGVFIGPGDLSADLGYVGQPNHPEVQSIIETTIKRIRACGLAPGILTGDETLARRYMEAGCVFTAVGADIGILARGAERLATIFKSP